MQIISMIVASLAILVLFIPFMVHSNMRILTNPVTYVFAIVAYSLILKVIYVALIHEPQYHPTDRVMVGETELRFLWDGVLVIASGVGGYLAGYLIADRAHAPQHPPRRPVDVPLPRSIVPALALGVFVCAIAFAIFVSVGAHSLTEMPLSAKRFPITHTSLARFGMADYYFLKAALMILPISTLAAWTIHKHDGGNWQVRILIFVLAFVLASAFTAFASLRLVLVLTAIQVLVVFSLRRGRHRWALMAFVVIVTGAQLQFVTEARNSGASTATATTAPSDNSNELPVPSTATPGAHWGYGVAVALLEGRYFMDVAKLAHVARHFPSQHDFLGLSVISGVTVPMPAQLSDVMPGRPERENWRRDWGGDPWIAPGEEVHLTLPRYIALYVYGERGNEITSGFAGWLYISFGITGVIVGFIALGAVHRVMADRMHGSLDSLGGLIAMMAFPTMTLLILNSEGQSVLGRLTTDIIIIPLVLVAAKIIATLTDRVKVGESQT